ncbi:MAG: hypothetical protein ABIA63_11280 [bacterium]
MDITLDEVKVSADCISSKPAETKTSSISFCFYPLSEPPEMYYGLRNSKAFNFWDNPEDDVY